MYDPLPPSPRLLSGFATKMIGVWGEGWVVHVPRARCTTSPPSAVDFGALFGAEVHPKLKSIGKSHSKRGPYS